MTTPRTDRSRLAVALRAAAAAALLVPAAGLAAIQNSAHDLAAGSSSVVKATTERDTCKFCHTPHHAQSTRLLWNHSPTAQATYSWGTDDLGNPKTALTSGTPLPTSMRPESKRCLSCHDGSISVGDALTGTIAMTAVAGRVDGSGHLTGAGKVVGAGGDMTGQHPVGIPYAAQAGYNGISSAVPSSLVGSGVKGGYYAVTNAGCTSSSGVCTTAPASGGVDGHRINLIPLNPGSTSNVGIECTTCHEPHNQYPYPYMMRVDTAFDALCQSCHNK